MNKKQYSDREKSSRSPFLCLIPAIALRHHKKILCFDFWNADIFDVEWRNITTEIRKQMIKSVSHGRTAATVYG